MWSLFKRRAAKPEGMSCVAVNQAGIAYAYLVPGEDNYGIKLCDFLPCEDASGKKLILKDYVRENNLTGSDCTYVLCPKDYRLILIDTPDVMEDELKNAARWAVSDFIDFPIDEAAVNIFTLPTLAESTAKLYVVVTRLSLLKEISLFISHVGLNLVKIDITELALTHAMNIFKEDKQGLATFFATDDGAHLLMTQDNTVYWERSIQFSQGQEQEVIPALQEKAKLNQEKPKDRQEIASHPQTSTKAVNSFSASDEKEQSSGDAMEGDEYFFVDNEMPKSIQEEPGLRKNAEINPSEKTRQMPSPTNHTTDDSLATKVAKESPKEMVKPSEEDPSVPLLAEQIAMKRGTKE